MGKIDLSNFGLSGRIGPIIAYTVNGKQRFRTYAAPTNPKTEKQTSHRTKFAFVSKKISPLYSEIKLGYNDPSIKYGKICGKVLREAVTGESPDYLIDYSKIDIAVGKLQIHANVKVHIDKKKNRAVILWDKRLISIYGPGRVNDRVHSICYNDVEQDFIKIRETVYRSDGEVTFILPDNWQPEDSHFWIYMKSFELGINSKSIYAVKTII